MLKTNFQPIIQGNNFYLKEKNNGNNLAFKATIRQIEEAINECRTSDDPSKCLDRFILATAGNTCKTGDVVQLFRRAHIGFVKKQQFLKGREVKDLTADEKEEYNALNKKIRDDLKITPECGRVYMSVLKAKGEHIAETGEEIGPCEGKMRNVEIALINIKKAEAFFQQLAKTHPEVPDVIPFYLAGIIQNNNHLSEIKIPVDGKEVSIGDIDFPAAVMDDKGEPLPQVRAKTTLNKLDSVINLKDQPVSCPAQMEVAEAIRCVCNHDGGGIGTTLGKIILPMLDLESDNPRTYYMINMITRPEKITDHSDL